MTYAYSVRFREDQNGTIIATVPDVPGAMTVGIDRTAALERLQGALLVMLAARMDDSEPIPRPSAPVRGQRTVILSPIVAAKLSIYQIMRARRFTPSQLRQRLGWNQSRIARLLDLRRRTPLEDLEAALLALGKRLVIEVRDAA